MARVLGLVDLHKAPDLGAITSDRNVGALTFLGRYTYVDIPLSNFANSNINTIGILVNKSPKSIIKHMENTMSYTNNTKLGKTIICYNEKFANQPSYNTNINNIDENMWLIDESRAKYVVIAPSHIVYSFDFNKLISKHIAKESKITIMYKKINNGKEEYLDQQIIEINQDNTLRSIHRNLALNDDINLSLATCIINVDTLKDLIAFSKKTSKFYSISDALNYIASTTQIDTYEFDGLVKVVSNSKSYLQTSLELLNFDELNQIVSPEWPIYTQTHDTAPAKYLENAWVRNSFVSNGAWVNGKVENSVVCRDVKIGENSVIRNSIILAEAEIGPNTIVENCIIDKQAKITNVKEIKGTKDNPLYVGQGDVI